MEGYPVTNRWNTSRVGAISAEGSTYLFPPRSNLDNSGLIQFALNTNLRRTEITYHFGVGEQMLGDLRGMKFRIPIGESQWKQKLIRKIFVHNPFFT